ncbi:hypothetical protein QBC44DRAFT_306251 [Cladorrhinum sp. PSN332]|nr:hypothetical protein QBC44DRAFT_306251 [Cladorrhinum sp. PSN332]
MSDRKAHFEGRKRGTNTTPKRPSGTGNSSRSAIDLGDDSEEERQGQHNQGKKRGSWGLESKQVTGPSPKRSANLNTSIQDLTSTKDSHARHEAQLRIASLGKEVDSLTQDKAVLETDNERLLRQEKFRLKQSMEQNTQLAILKETIADERHSTIQHLETIAVLNKELTATQDRLKQQVKDNESLCEGNNIMRQSLVNVTEEKTNLQLILNQKGNYLADLEMSHRQVTQQLKEQTDIVSNLESQVKRYDETTSELKSQVALLKSQTHQMDQGTSLVRSGYNALVDTSNSLKEELKGKEFEVAYLKEELERKKAEHAHSVAKVTALQEEIARKEVQFEEMADECEKKVQEQQKAVLVADRDLRNSSHLLVTYQARLRDAEMAHREAGGSG